MLKIIEKDILSVTEGYIFQQVNCRGVMGAGLAKKISDKWPTVKKEYLEICKKNRNFPEMLLGNHKVTDVESGLYIVNIFGQLNYGYGERFTDYGALKLAFNEFNETMDLCYNYEYDVYFPFGFGCGLGGGNWNVVKRFIDAYFPEAIICKLPENEG